MNNPILQTLFSRFIRDPQELEANKLAIEKTRRENTPRFSLFDLGDQPREMPAETEAILSEIFNHQRTKSLPEGVEGPPAPLSLIEGPDERINRIGNELSSTQSRLSEQQKPTLTVDEYAKLKNAGLKGEITPKFLMELAARKENAQIMAGKQEKSFEHQEEMASKADKMKREAEERAEARKPPTENMSKDSTYANRIEQADPIIEEQTDYIKKLNPLWFTVQKGSPDFANAIKDPQFRQYDQARRNFLNSVLRRESGAVISPSEFIEGNRQYFPLPGDDERTLEQKRQNRLVAMSTFKTSAGKAYKPLYSSPIEVGIAMAQGKLTERQAQIILKRDFGLKD